MKVVDDDTKVEVWKNPGKGTIVVKETDEQSGRLRDNIVHGGSTFTITPAERRLNENQAFETASDPFKNGLLIPVQLIETSADKEAIFSNPEVISESEIASLIRDGKTKSKSFNERVASVSSPGVLRRILEVAEEGNGTVRQVEFIKARLGEVQESFVFEMTPVGQV